MTETFFQIQIEEAEYTHGMVYGQYKTLEECKAEDLELIETCKQEGDECNTDYIAIEPIVCEVDEDGEIEEVIDINDPLEEYVINEPPS